MNLSHTIVQNENYNVLKNQEKLLLTECNSMVKEINDHYDNERNLSFHITTAMKTCQDKERIYSTVARNWAIIGSLLSKKSFY